MKSKTKLFQKILVLAPHTDDGEFGAGASIAKFLEEGSRVWYAAFSTCEESVPQGFPKNILEKEVKQATKKLGIPAGNLFIYKFPVRHFPAHRQNILDEIIKLRREIEPDLVFLPSVYDVHQDHRTVLEEGVRAFKQSSSMLGYEAPWNSVHTSPNKHIDPREDYFMRLEERHVKKKIDAIRMYQSQARRVYSDREYLKSLARVRGAQIAVPFAEAFQVIRIIVK